MRRAAREDAQLPQGMPGHNGRAEGIEALRLPRTDKQLRHGNRNQSRNGTSNKHGNGNVHGAHYSC